LLAFEVMVLYVINKHINRWRHAVVQSHASAQNKQRAVFTAATRTSLVYSCI